MSPVKTFQNAVWTETVKQRRQKKRDEEVFATIMKEHDYSECYCNALKNPPWGGYSIEEQILHEIQERKKNAGQRRYRITGTSSYTYLKKDQEAILGRSTVSQTMRADSFGDIVTTQSENFCISKEDGTHKSSISIQDLPNEVLYQILSHLDPPELGSLSEASRRFTTLIGLVPCGDLFLWARHRCLIHGHARLTPICGDCIAALIARNNRSICKRTNAFWVSAWRFF